MDTLTHPSSSTRCIPRLIRPHHASYFQPQHHLYPAVVSCTVFSILLRIFLPRVLIHSSRSQSWCTRNGRRKKYMRSDGWRHEGRQCNPTQSFLLADAECRRHSRMDGRVARAQAWKTAGVVCNHEQLEGTNPRRPVLAVERVSSEEPPPSLLPAVSSLPDVAYSLCRQVAQLR